MKKSILFLALALVGTNLYAANVPLSTIPTSWRLQNYIGDGVVSWFTGSACTNGQLSFGSNASMDDKNRYWSVIMAAKVAGKPVVVYYEDSSAPNTCIITSFLLKEE